VVDYNSGYKKPVARKTTVKGILVGNMNLSGDLFDSHFKAACENGHLVAGSGYVWHPEESGPFAEAIEWVAENDDDPQDFVAAMNRWQGEQ
jgi:hypothetical protein